MRNVVLAFATAMMVGGCGDNGGSLKLDGGNHDLAGGSNFDLTGSVTDLAGAKGKACGDIFQCVFGGMGKTASQCAAGHPMPAIAAYNAIFDCVNNSCGNTTSDAGTDMPCNGSMTDMGIAACNTCFYDSMTGGEINWQLPGGGNNMCTTATDKWCGACINQLDTCLNQCFQDADCAGFTTPLTCMGASGTNPGTCG
jgi:hypothetical protein